MCMLGSWNSPEGNISACWTESAAQHCDCRRLKQRVRVLGGDSREMSVLFASLCVIIYGKVD
jgi:hypothetical protein